MTPTYTLVKRVYLHVYFLLGLLSIAQWEMPEYNTVEIEYLKMDFIFIIPVIPHNHIINLSTDI